MFIVCCSNWNWDATTLDPNPGICDQFKYCDTVWRT